MAWYGNSRGHAKAGRIGGKNQGRHNNPGNFANDPKKASRAGKKGGKESGARKQTLRALDATEQELTP